MPKRLLVYSRTQPARTIVAVVAVFTFLAGLFIFTPWFVSAPLTPSAAVAFNWFNWVGAGINTAVAIPAIWAVRKNTPKAIAGGAMTMFLWYLFVTLTRLFLGEAASLLWVPTLIIAVVMSVIYIEQGYLARRGGID